MERREKVPDSATGREFRILFVCTGNICRSPFAQILARHLIDDRLGADAGLFEVRSAGVRAVVDSPMHPASRRALEPWGLSESAEGFRARQLTVADLASADLVLTASPAHRADALRMRPQSLTNTFTMLEFARLLGSVDLTCLSGGPVIRAITLVQTARSARGMTRLGAPEDDTVPDPIGGSAVDHLNSARLSADALSATVAALVPAVASA